MTDLAELEPTKKENVIDLVRAAGFDVSDWSNSKFGQQGASRNPKYCYEWAFQSETAVILNLWYEDLAVAGGRIVRRGSYRADAAAQRGAGGKPMWAARAGRADEALAHAAAKGLSVYVIINKGHRRKEGDPTATASRVEYRQLDDQPWTIGHYDQETGAHLLMRGLSQPVYFDQFSLREIGTAFPERKTVTATSIKRERAVRDTALARANGRCEYCGVVGFPMANGGIYLETHHIIGLAEGGADLVSNVVALCPNHHREAHYGAARDDLGKKFSAIVAKSLKQ